MSLDLIHQLDHSMPAAKHANLGTTLQAVILGLNNALTKLDAGGAATTATGLAAALGTQNLANFKVTDLVTLGNSEN